MSVARSTPYRSPLAKLVRFFSGSRDNWKTKCQAAKRENKSLKHRLSKMKESRDRWKMKAKQAVSASEASGPPQENNSLRGPEEECKNSDPSGPHCSRSRQS